MNNFFINIESLVHQGMNTEHVVHIYNEILLNHKKE